jgi:hypothetical protein
MALDKKVILAISYLDDRKESAENLRAVLLLSAQVLVLVFLSLYLNLSWT